MKLLTFIFTSFLLINLSYSTSYTLKKDLHLVHDSDTIVTGQIIQKSTGYSLKGETEYKVWVSETFKGSDQTELTFYTLGGVTSDGMALKVFGGPVFLEGDEVILFLNKDQQGRLGIHQIILGAFTKKTIDGNTYVWRDLSEAKAYPSKHQQPSEAHYLRDWDLWKTWIQKTLKNLPQEANYWLKKPKHLLEASKFNYAESDGIRVRWEHFDQGNYVSWKANPSGQPGMYEGGIENVRQAMTCWSASSKIDYRLEGYTQNTNGLSALDTENTVLFGDPNDIIPGTYDCESGGTLAVGGVWHYQDQFGSYNGVTHKIIFAADVVTQDGAACAFAGHDNLDGEEIFAHEFGHTLGLAHSCSSRRSCESGTARDRAIMRYSAHLDGRGASLDWEDVAAVQELYGSAHDVGFEVASTLIYPWLSHNTSFSSTVIVNNTSNQPAQLHLTGRRTDGTVYHSSQQLEKQSFLKLAIAELFPDLPEGPGLTLVIESDNSTLKGSWLTFNQKTSTGKSPAQSSAIVLLKDLAKGDGRSGTEILFSYLPNSEGFTSVPVIINLSPVPQDVTIHFYSSQGDAGIPGQVIRELSPFMPYPVDMTQSNASGLDLQMIAKSSGLITGIDFVFNGMGEPAMGNTTALIPDPSH